MKLSPAAAAAALATIALLAACSPKSGGASKAASGSTVAPASGPDVQVDLSNMPHQRAGLWKSVLDDGDGKPAESTSCLSGKIPAIPKMPAGCSKLDIKRTFMGAYRMDMNCATPEFTMIVSSATGDFQTHVSGDSTMSMSNRKMPARTIKMHTEQTWLGPCAPGQKPDDGGS